MISAYLKFIQGFILYHNQKNSTSFQNSGYIVLMQRRFQEGYLSGFKQIFVLIQQ